MQAWPHELFLDYTNALQRHPGLDREKFAALWLEADALARLAVEVGLEPEDIPGLIMDPK